MLYKFKMMQLSNELENWIDLNGGALGSNNTRTLSLMLVFVKRAPWSKFYICKRLETSWFNVRLLLCFWVKLFNWLNINFVWVKAGVFANNINKKKMKMKFTFYRTIMKLKKKRSVSLVEIRMWHGDAAFIYKSRTIA